jgi:hypothetical protein
VTDDKKARNWGNNADTWMVTFTGLLMLIGIGTVVIFYRQFREMSKQTGVLKDQLETTDRPWIKAVPQAWSPITFRDNGDLSFNVAFVLSNVGRSVATDVTIYSGAFIPTWGASHFTEPLERQTELCKKIEPEALRFALFPNETKQLNVGVVITREEMEKNVVPPPPGVPIHPPGKRTAAILFGCVDYKFASLRQHHQTGFIYDIVGTDPKTPDVPYLIIVGQDLPADHVKLQGSVFGGDYAN